MSHGVLKATPALIEEMKQHYTHQLQANIPQGGVFSAKLPGCSITAYKSGKVLFQGKGSQVELGKWTDRATKVPPKTKSAPKSSGQYRPPENIAELGIIGSDEVGTGDYFGPITVVATFVDAAMAPLLKELGVKDSKHLKDPQIIEIAQSIKAVVPYSLLILRNEKYNELQQSGMSQGKIKALLHNQAINHVYEKLKPREADGVLIDQFAEPGVYYNYLKGKERKITENVYFSTKAEGVHLSVAAASILARYAFLKEFDKLSEQAGMKLLKGAGPLVDQAAAKLIRKNGLDCLPQFTKLHFANTEKAKKLAFHKKT